MSNPKHYPNGNEPGPEAFRAALIELSDALAGTPFRALLMGGVGSFTLARPRHTDDIDLFVHPDDVTDLTKHLADRGFETEVNDPTWLHKAHRYGVLIDLIFRSTGDIYVDDEMLERSSVQDYKGVAVRTVSPEDLLVIKAVAAAEHSPHHWYDAIGVVRRCDLDWAYLADRARRHGPRRVLSLLLYAESIDLAVPTEIIESLFRTVHTGATP